MWNTDNLEMHVLLSCDSIRTSTSHAPPMTPYTVLTLLFIHFSENNYNYFRPETNMCLHLRSKHAVNLRTLKCDCLWEKSIFLNALLFLYLRHKLQIDSIFKHRQIMTFKTNMLFDAWGILYVKHHRLQCVTYARVSKMFYFYFYIFNSFIGLLILIINWKPRALFVVGWKKKGTLSSLLCFKSSCLVE